MSKYKILFLFLLVTCLSHVYGQAPVIIPKPPQIDLPLDASGHYTVKVGDIATVTNSTDSTTRYRYYPKEFTCDDRGPQKVNLTASTNGSAGNPTPGNVSFRSMSDLAFDLSGNMFVLESGSHLIRKITPQGDVSVYAGTGGSGYKDGPAATALFAEPAGIACDSLGNLYISETGNNVIRKVSTDGVVSTYAGTGDAGAHDGKADKAQFNFPNKLALDRNNNLYVSEFGNFKIRKI